MIKETLRTLKENPKALLLCFAITVVLLGFMLLMIYVVMPDINSLETMNEMDIFSFLAKIIIFMLLTMIVSLLSVFIFMPAFGQYVYEMCKGKVESGWFKRGVKRSWWKIFVMSLLISSATYFLFVPVGIFSALLGRAFFVGIILILLMMVAVGAFYFIGFSAVIAEDNFSDALSNMFKIGIKYLWKIALAVIAIYLPIYVFSFIYSFSYLNKEIEDIAAFMNQYSIMYFIVSIYGILTAVFLFTYSMKNYLNEKALKNRNILQTADEQDNEQSSSI